MSLLGWIETCNVKISCESHIKIVLSLRLEIYLTAALFAKSPVFQISFLQSWQIYPWQNGRAVNVFHYYYNVEANRVDISAICRRNLFREKKELKEAGDGIRETS